MASLHAADLERHHAGPAKEVRQLGDPDLPLGHCGGALLYRYLQAHGAEVPAAVGLHGHRV